MERTNPYHGNLNDTERFTTVRLLKPALVLDKHLEAGTVVTLGRDAANMMIKDGTAEKVPFDPSSFPQLPAERKAERPVAVATIRPNPSPEGYRPYPGPVDQERFVTVIFLKPLMIIHEHVTPGMIRTMPIPNAKLLIEQGHAEKTRFDPTAFGEPPAKRPMLTADAVPYQRTAATLTGKTNRR